MITFDLFFILNWTSGNIETGKLEEELMMRKIIAFVSTMMLILLALGWMVLFSSFVFQCMNRIGQSGLDGLITDGKQGNDQCD